MKRLKDWCSLLVLISIVGFVAAGCYRHSFGQVLPDRPSDVAKWNHNILWGIISVNGHTDGGVCDGAPPNRVSTYVGPVGLLLGVVTGGIYVPTTTEVWCAEAKRAKR